MSAHEALAALARDLVEEVATGMAVELAAGMAAAGPVAPVGPAQVPPPKTGAAAVYPQLGASLAVQPGDTISGLAYAHLQPPPPPGQPGGQPPIAGQ